MTVRPAMLTILTPMLAVSALPTPRLVRIAKAMGYKALIDARPVTGNSAATRPRPDVKAQARATHMAYHRVPVSDATSIDVSTIERFDQAVADAPMPTLIFCETGERAVALWAAAMIGTMPDDIILSAAARAGHDASHLFGTDASPERRAA